MMYRSKQPYCSVCNTEYDWDDLTALAEMEYDLPKEKYQELMESMDRQQKENDLICGTCIHDWMHLVRQDKALKEGESC